MPRNLLESLPLVYINILQYPLHNIKSVQTNIFVDLELYSTLPLDHVKIIIERSKISVNYFNNIGKSIFFYLKQTQHFFRAKLCFLTVI